jgi:SAM-dependent methyltransferase
MRFAFGKNWKSFSEKALKDELVENARISFESLFNGIELKGKSFIDIGFGQGLTLILAKQKGADVLGVDIDENNIQALEICMKKSNCIEKPRTVIASILDEELVKEKIGTKKFDIVHSWGVLHHTGNMHKAIQNSCKLVKENGYLICAIYNRHWSSGTWKIIKFMYNIMPEFFRFLMIVSFYPIIYIAKFLVTCQNPQNQERGMNFFYNVIDWVGGYPYEFASIDEVTKLFHKEGFECLKVIPAKVPTGCNEFVFKKTKKLSDNDPKE